MDQRSDHIRQDIESTRAALDQKIDSLESKARQTFDVRHQVSERPWMALGAAVAAGFVLGSLGGEDEQRWHGQPITTTNYNQHAFAPAADRQQPIADRPTSPGDSFMSQFDDEIEMLKGAAISAITTLLHDSIRSYLPAMGQYLQGNAGPANRAAAPATQHRGMATGSASTAPNTSYTTSASQAGFDSPPASRGQSNQMSNPEAGGVGSYYPPGSPGAAGREYPQTNHPPSAQARERAVGEEGNYWREAQ